MGLQSLNSKARGKVLKGIQAAKTAIMGDNRKRHGKMGKLTNASEIKKLHKRKTQT